MLLRVCRCVFLVSGSKTCPDTWPKITKTNDNNKMSKISKMSKTSKK